MSLFKVADKDCKNLDFHSFTFNHSISTDHINLEFIENVIQDFPPFHISFTSDSSDIKADFEKILTDKTQLLNAEKMTQNLLTSKSYIALSAVETHPLLRDLCNQLTSEIKQTYNSKIKGATYWLFIASPDAVTPFHFDRFSNFLFQIRGSKELAVFPNFNNQVLNPEDCEKYCNNTLVKSSWNEEVDQLAVKYQLKPGSAVHIPFTSAHYIKNGSEDISITISVFFHSPRTIIWSRAMRFNDSFKHFFKKFKIDLESIQPTRKKNYLKAYLFSFCKLVK